MNLFFSNRTDHNWLVLFVGAVLLAGCSKSSKTNGPQLDLVPVSGTITLDGTPLSEATVSFAYQGTPPEGFYGSGAGTDAQGHYELQTMGKKGAVPGTYKVTVSRPLDASGMTINPEEGMDMEQLRQAGVLKETVPLKYTDATATELTTTIEKGKADGYDFTLKSG
jgi:hypothetical protein